jgi:polysaccharide chain length determinant protein (PEP-CTERM system associated)
MLGHRKLNAEDYVAILKRRRWLILAPVILMPVIAFGITFLIPAQYISQTLVLIEEQKVGDDIVKPVVTTSLDSRLASMREQILSRSRIQPIVERYNLFPSSRLTMDDRVEMTRHAIAVKPIRSEVASRAGLPGFFVTFTANDARTAQQVCGDITSLFISASIKLNEDSAQGTTEFLKGQLEDAKRTLDEQDKKLEEFQSKSGGSLPEQSTPNITMINSLNTQLEAANQELANMRQARAYQESMLSQLSQSTQPTGPSGAPIGQTPTADQEELQKLLALEADLNSRYTPSNPDVISTHRKIAELRKKIAQAPQSATAAPSGPLVARNNDSVSVQQLKAQLHSSEIGIQAKEQQQASIQSQIARYQALVQASPAVAAQYKDLSRGYETAQKFYDDLLAKMNQAQMATSLEHQQQGASFTLMDAANLPDSPTFPNRTLFAVAGLAGGLFIGLVLAGFLEYKDTALRTEQDVWTFTKLPTLAVIGYSGEIEPPSPRPGKLARLRGLVKRKAPEEVLSKAHG